VLLVVLWDDSFGEDALLFLGRRCLMEGEYGLFCGMR
jgi:hypothetical protein